MFSTSLPKENQRGLVARNTETRFALTSSDEE